MLKYIIIIFIILSNRAIFAKSHGKQKAKLLFKSSFEKGVYLNHPDKRDSSVWWQDIRGSDEPNFSWPIKLKGATGTLQLIVDSNKSVGGYIENRIESVRGIEGKQTRVLHQIIKKKDYEWTQVPYVVYTGKQEQEDLYIRYALKFPKNVSKLLGKQSWLTFCEYKTVGDYRLAFYIYSDDHGKLYWYVHGDNAVLENVPYQEYWSMENRKIAVPQGEWFTVELFWHRSDQEDGRVWWAIDGKVITDYYGRTKIKDPINEIMLFTNYAQNPIHQWVDNIEIWDNFPCGEGKSCFKKTLKSDRGSKIKISRSIQ